MGRRKLEYTPEQIMERKQRWWGPDRNARRRERYRQDAQFRAQTVQKVRDKYRKEREDAGAAVRQDDCRTNLDRLHLIGQERELHAGGQPAVQALTFTVDELGEALTRNAQVLYRWISSGMFPTPAFKALNARNRWQAVYTEAEARALLGVFGEHQTRSQYYRAFHTETRDSLFAAVLAARS
jgi:hypothetical protein